jgi:hypothetical protein
MSAREIRTTHLAIEEQEHVRDALHFLRAKLGTWNAVGRAPLRGDDALERR